MSNLKEIVQNALPYSEGSATYVERACGEAIKQLGALLGVESDFIVVSEETIKRPLSFANRAHSRDPADLFIIRRKSGKEVMYLKWDGTSNFTANICEASRVPFSAVRLFFSEHASAAPFVEYTLIKVKEVCEKIPFGFNWQPYLDGEAIVLGKFVMTETLCHSPEEKQEISELLLESLKGGLLR